MATTMRPRRQASKKAKVRKFVSITPMTDEDGDYVVLRRYKEKEKVGEAVLHFDGCSSEAARQTVEDYRNT